MCNSNKLKTQRLNVKSFLVIILFLLFLLPKKAFAQVVINEFSSNSDPEWVELFNTSTTQTVNLTAWQLTDSNDISSDDLVLSGCISPRAFRTFSRSEGWLNNSGTDTINLKDSSSGVVDQVTYGEGGIVEIPANGKSVGRDPDGNSNWRLFDVPSQTNNDCQLPTIAPTPTLSSTPIPSLTLTPTPASKAVYKINKAKDDGGNELSSVNIYVDGSYIHHQDDEILTFCDGCHCDDDHLVDCGFGQHIVRTEKNGYENWQETKTFNAGDSYEVNPVMARIVSSSTPTPTLPLPTSTPTPTPTIKPSLTPTKTPTPTVSLSLTATPSGEVLGEEIASRSGLPQLSEEGNGVNNSKERENKSDFLFPAIAVVLGLAFIGFSIFSFLKGRRPKEEQAEVVV